MKAVTIVGIGDNGCVGLSARAFNAVANSQVLVGGDRHLNFFSDYEGHKISFAGGITKVLEEISERAIEENIVILSSGDPLFYGVGELVTKKIGKEHIEIIPYCSSVQIAFSRLGIKWEDAGVISLHGRPIKGLVNKLQHYSKVAILTDDKNTPKEIARYLRYYSENDWHFFLCEDLENTSEKVHKLELDDVDSFEKRFSLLNVIVLIRKNVFSSPALRISDEEDFQKKMPKNGLITKKEIRALALMNLALRKNSCVWDIGAGSGSVAIEAAKIAYEGSVYGIEIDESCYQFCLENIKHFKVDNVEVIHGLAPEALRDLPSPDAVFIGGTKGEMDDIVLFALSKLANNGKIVISAITFENVHNAYEICKKSGYEFDVQLIQVSRGQKLASYKRYEALNPIHLFTITKTIQAGISQ